MQSHRAKLLKAGIIALVGLAVLYVGYCTGIWGKRNGLLHYVFQCSCPRSMENIRIRKRYSEHAEIIFSACDDIGPIPSPDGQKIAVINYSEPDESYVWDLQTDERIPFSWLGTDLDWLTGDLLFVRRGLGMNVVDIVARTEYSITVRTDVRLVNGEIDPVVLSALREARYVILTERMIAAISPDALASPAHSFVIAYYDEFAHILADSRSDGESYERMRQFLQDQDIDYLDYVVRRGTDTLSINETKKYREGREDVYADLVSPDGRFFYRESWHESVEGGIYLVETDEKIVDSIPNWIPVDWVGDSIIIHRMFGGDYLFQILPDMAGINLCWIHEPWLKLRVPAEYNASDMSPDGN